jgi:hypothetical protein
VDIRQSKVVNSLAFLAIGADFGILWTYDGEYMHASAITGVPSQFAEFLKQGRIDQPKPATGPAQRRALCAAGLHLPLSSHAHQLAHSLSCATPW